VLTTTSITAVSVSTRSAQSTCIEPPDWIQRITATLIVSVGVAADVDEDDPGQARRTMIMKPVVTYSEALAPIEVAERPAIIAPISGRKTMA
jgi:hypothetical protein